jgi:hypothetical protein
MKPKDTHDAPAERANPPGLYECPCCGERLSGPAFFYTCPRMPVENQGRAE